MRVNLIETEMADGNLRLDLASEEDKDLVIELMNRFPDERALGEILDWVLANCDIHLAYGPECGMERKATVLARFSEPRKLALWMLDQAQPLETGGEGNRLAGSWPDETGEQRVWVQDPIDVWIYPPFRKRSPEMDLLTRGHCIFVRIPECSVPIAASQSTADPNESAPTVEVASQATTSTTSATTEG